MNKILRGWSIINAFIYSVLLMSRGKQMKLKSLNLEVPYDS